MKPIEMHPRGCPMSGEKGDWSLRYFGRAADSFALFYTNPILSGLSLLFARLFCLQHYLAAPGLV
jgi:hypothetical protein